MTNEGATLSTRQSAAVLTDRTGRAQVFVTRYAVDNAVIDPRGTVIVYTTRLAPGSAARISAIQLASQTEVLLGSGFDISNPIITADSATVLYLNWVNSLRRLIAVGAGGANERTVSTETESLQSAISRDGLTAFATTVSSRLIRIDTGSGASRELIGPTPFVLNAVRDYLPATTAPVGSVLGLVGVGLDSAQNWSVCGLPRPPVGASNQIQIPWDSPAGPCRILLSSASPFETALDLTIAALDPKFAGGVGGPVIFRDGFQGYVTPLDPARAGDIVSFYMSGLGPLDRQGNVGPGFGCRLNDAPAEIRFAGAAAGFPGYYQINLVIPPVTAPFNVLVCGFDFNLQDRTPIAVMR